MMEFVANQTQRKKVKRERSFSEINKETLKEHRKLLKKLAKC